MILARMKNKALALAVSSLVGAFFMPMAVHASDGNGGVDITLPNGWQTKEYVSQVTPFEYSNGDTKVRVRKVSASFNDEAYRDITDTLQVTIKENGTLKVKVAYSDGGEATNSFNIENFDLERPTVNAKVVGEVMYLTAKDDISGVKEIGVNGKVFTQLKDGQMCVDVKELESTQEYFTVYAKDNAGNTSKTFKVKNPYFIGEKVSGSEDKSLNNPNSIEATDPTSARGTVTEYTDSKEFYTILADEKTFYLVIDRDMSQENVYLLTEADSNDLLNFVNYNGVDVESGDIPLYELNEENVDASVQQKEDKQEKKEEGKTDSNVFVIVMVAVLAGVGYYVIKIRKKKEDLDDAEEMDAFTTPEDEELGGGIEYVDGDEDES